jgi:hypothetical protein
MAMADLAFSTESFALMMFLDVLMGGDGTDVRELASGPDC